MLLSAPIGVLLDDAERCRRLEAVFAEEMGRYASEFEETRQIVVGPQNKAIGVDGVGVGMVGSRRIGWSSRVPAAN
jgi:hypothetical protein